jgi:hypothetical protein
LRQSIYVVGITGIFLSDRRHVLRFRPGVVAPDFKVHRTANLRIVDASVIPFTFSVAPLATVFAIAEKVIRSARTSQFFFSLLIYPFRCRPQTLSRRLVHQ